MLRIRFERRKLRLTINDLAYLADVSPSRLSEIERGMRVPGLGIKARLAATLNVPVAELLAEAPEE